MQRQRKGRECSEREGRESWERKGKSGCREKVRVPGERERGGRRV